jgi:hypothetical protein
METKFNCQRQWKPGLVFYVRELPGDGGADYGYTEEPGKAVPISAYWMRRFRADMNRVSAKGVVCRDV